MYRAIAFCAALGMIGGLSAHQFTPTYPELETSYIPGVSVVNMSIFNSRQEIDWYSIGVYDSNWNSIAFASTDKLLQLPYLGRKDISLYIRKADTGKVTYICSKSKTVASQASPAIITSRICSKIKSETNEKINSNDTVVG